MTLTKYEEIMERIVVAPQMRQRILENLREASPADAGKNVVRLSSYRRYVSAAACAAVLAVGALTYRRLQPDISFRSGSTVTEETAAGAEEFAEAAPAAGDGGQEISQSVSGNRSDAASALPEEESALRAPALAQAAFAVTEAADAAELSGLVGFPVEDLSELPFEVTERTYTAYGADLAEITCTGETQTLTFRKSPGTEDNSGDYNEYESETQADVSGAPATLKGNGGRVCLAVWTDGQYTWSIAAPDGLEEAVMLALAEEFGQ